MLRRLHLFTGLLVCALVACGGAGSPVFISTGPTPAPTATPPPGVAAVSFLVVVPAPAPAARRRPNVVLPSSATAVTFTLDSVNGTASTGTPTNQTLSASNPACVSVGGQLSCAFTVAAPVGTLIYTITAYNGTAVIAEGNVAITTANGQTASAPFTLTGTVAKVVITVGNTVVGSAAVLPLTVQAKDANGNTILGTYTSAITLTDTDASGQTTIATSGSDSPGAGTLISSSDTATLHYAGGVMAAAATIGATVTGVSAPNVTSASFLPTTNDFAQSGTLTFGITYNGASNALDSQAPPPTPNPTTSSYPVAVATGQTLGTVTNLIGVTGLQNNTNLAGISNGATTYYSWSSGPSGPVLGLVGYSDPNNANYQNDTLLPLQQSLIQTCTAPYPQLLILGATSNWDIYAGSGPCTTVYTDTTGDTDTYAYASNGSYTDNYNLGGGGWAYCSCVTGASRVTVDALGNLNYAINGNYGNGTLAVAAPSAGATTVAVQFTDANPYPIVATPLPSSAPNPWLAIGLANGVPPSPLFSDKMTVVGAISALPAACLLPAGLVPATNPPLSEIDESIIAADPMGSWLPFYSAISFKHYYLNGVGEVCNEQQLLADVFAGTDGGIDSQLNTGPPVWAFNQNLTGGLAWYYGVDTHYNSYRTDQFTFITQTTLTAVNARVRDTRTAQAMASHALTAASYALVRSELRHAAFMGNRRASLQTKWPTTPR